MLHLCIADGACTCSVSYTHLVAIVGGGPSGLSCAYYLALMGHKVTIFEECSIECMEFPNLGEYHDNLSLEEAIRIYQEIPAERMNGIKGIGFELKDGSDYEGPFPILTGQTIDLDSPCFI